jgi:phosphoglycolate phosphatase-like HAD superfamily hydrolase
MQPTNTLVLWDIDGTILRGGGIGQRVLEVAFREVLGANADDAPYDLGGLRYHGNTDQAIIAAGLTLYGVAATPESVRAIAETYVRILGVEVGRHNPFRRLPGVRELVERLDGHAFHQGLGTGNLEAAAWLKVGAVGLSAHFAFGGFGSDAHERVDLLRIGRDRGAARLGVAPERCRVVVIGDTLDDIAAARAIGAEVLAVATGGASMATLAAAQPDYLFEGLSGTEEVALALTARRTRSA